MSNGRNKKKTKIIILAAVLLLALLCALRYHQTKQAEYQQQHPYDDISTNNVIFAKWCGDHAEYFQMSLDAAKDIKEDLLRMYEDHERSDLVPLLQWEYQVIFPGVRGTDTDATGNYGVINGQTNTVFMRFYPSAGYWEVDGVFFKLPDEDWTQIHNWAYRFDAAQEDKAGKLFRWPTE